MSAVGLGWWADFKGNVYVLNLSSAVGLFQIVSQTSRSQAVTSQVPSENLPVHRNTERGTKLTIFSHLAEISSDTKFIFLSKVPQFFFENPWATGPDWHFCV